MSAIRLRGATSGTTDVVAAAIAGDGVLTLPTGTGTLATAAYVDAAVAAGGKVLQVVSVTKVDTFTTSSTSYVDITGLTATITPSSASSKILVLTKVAVNENTTDIASIQLLRGATAIGGGTAVGSRGSATSSFYAGAYGTGVMDVNYLDSPASASAQTYKIQCLTSGSNLRINTSYNDENSATRTRTSSTITLMEIGA